MSSTASLLSTDRPLRHHGTPQPNSPSNGCQLPATNHTQNLATNSTACLHTGVLPGGTPQLKALHETFHQIMRLLSTQVSVNIACHSTNVQTFGRHSKSCHKAVQNLSSTAGSRWANTYQQNTNKDTATHPTAECCSKRQLVLLGAGD